MIWGHDLRNDEADSVTRYVAYAAEGTQLGDGPKKTWKEVVDNDSKCLHLRSSDAPDHKN